MRWRSEGQAHVHTVAQYKPPASLSRAAPPPPPLAASVDKLAHKWDNKTARLERLQCELRDCPRHKPARAVKLKQRIMVLQRQLAELQVGCRLLAAGGGVNCGLQCNAT